MSNDGARGARTVEADEFKAKCLELMDEVAASGEEIVITKNGRPISRIVPYREKPKSLFGIDGGRIELLNDIIEPLDVEWEAETGPIDAVVLSELDEETTAPRTDERRKMAEKNMSLVEIRDHSLWAKHIHGNDPLKEVCGRRWLMDRTVALRLVSNR